MTMRLALIFAAPALMSASAFAQETPSPPPEAKALAESCAAHKFETTVAVEGKPRGSKVKLCGKEGQGDSDWLNTLKDAVRKVEGDDKMTLGVKNQITSALKAEIASLEGGKTPAPAVGGIALAGSKLAGPAPDYSALPAIPDGSRLVSASPFEPPPEYSKLPPLPTASKVAESSAVPMKKPRLTLRCSAPGQSGVESCTFFERGTLLTVRADEDLAAGTSLRFLRKGDLRGEVDLAAMKQGQSLRAKLPAEVCSGVLTSKVEIQVVAKGKGGGQVVDRLGPFGLRCRG